MNEFHLVERSATGGYWRAVQQRPSGNPLLNQPHQRSSFWREPAATRQDAFGAYCWQRPSGGMILYSDPNGGMVGSVEGLETLYAYGFTPAFGEPIESGATE